MTDHPSEKCAVVACSPRSGSTLLTRILNAHSKVSSPFEIGLPFLFLGDAKEDTVLEKTAVICRHYGLDTTQARYEPWYLITEILRHERKEFLVVKDPRHAVFLEAIFIVLGDVPVIHLTRDVRSVSHSTMFKHDFLLGMNRWFEYNSIVEANRYRFSRFLHIRYEDLASQPVEVVTGVLRLLGYQYEPGMEDYWNFKHTDDELKLWGGVSPKKSSLQRQLYTKAISPAGNRPVPEPVLELYQEHEHIRRLNESYGYR